MSTILEITFFFHNEQYLNELIFLFFIYAFFILFDSSEWFKNLLVSNYVNVFIIESFVMF